MKRDLSGTEAKYCRSLDVWIAGRREILWLAVKMSISFAKEGK